jgi:GTP-binding protein Era
MPDDTVPAINFRSGTVALVGKPNVGKSTLMNAVIGQKVSIVSDKPQTTRRRVLGIANGNHYQIAFIDTPGYHEPHTRLGRGMLEQARSALSDVDLILVVGDGSHYPGEMDKQIARWIGGFREHTPTKTLLCLNKMDQLKAEDVQRNVDAFNELFKPEDYMLTSATRGQNVEKLISMVVDRLPERAPQYADDELTDQSSRFLAAELVREKILQASRQEVPHSVAVMVDEWEELPGLTRISATVLVEKASQRGILIGKQGQFLKRIGTTAREEIEKLLGAKVYLELHVRVEEDWRMSPRLLHELEYSD